MVTVFVSENLPIITTTGCKFIDLPSNMYWWILFNIFDALQNLFHDDLAYHMT